MNNTIYSGSDIVGYRCYTCDKIVQSMLGDDCNECTAKVDRHREQMKVMKESNKAKFCKHCGKEV